MNGIGVGQTAAPAPRLSTEVNTAPHFEGMAEMQFESELGGLDAEHTRKLAVLGLPWETSEETLKVYFGQFGPIEHAEVMKDRYTGKSRGFGFVTFADAASANRALAVEHTIDGRRCEAKIALPKGEPTPPRTTRIFVARIPPSVTESQFRSYFEAFGKLQDAYMPRDHSKQGFRGIGFVTFASADSVEKVMAVKHWMNGHEVAIDRATPKDEPSALRSMFARLPLADGQRRSFDNGAGIIGPGLTSVNIMGSGLINSSGIEHQYHSSLRSLSEDRPDNNSGGSVSRSSMDSPGMHLANSGGLGTFVSGDGLSGASQALRASQALGLSHMNLGLGALQAQQAAQAQQQSQSAAAAAAAVATSAALHSLAKSQMQTDSNSMNSYNAMMVASGLHHGGFSPELSASILSNALHKANLGSGMASPSMLGDVNAAAVQHLMAAAVHGRRSMDSAMPLKRLENPAIATARAGPRIFIGKLTKDTSEADVKDYFVRFGYVMDVYLPKSKDNKTEHRGFGFVTFETDAAIQRVVSHGAHRLRGSTIAIDIAMPKVEEEAQLLERGDSPSPLAAFQNLPNLMVQRI